MANRLYCVPCIAYRKSDGVTTERTPWQMTHIIFQVTTMRGSATLFPTANVSARDVRDRSGRLILSAVTLLFVIGCDSRAATPNEESGKKGVSGERHQADNKVVRLVTGPTSNKYLERGFKVFRFGDSTAKVKSLAAENKVPLADGLQNFFIEDGNLIGYLRAYRGDNAGYLDRFRAIFGGATKENMSETLTTRTGSTEYYTGTRVPTAHRHETLLVRYYFPNSIAFLQFNWRAGSKGNSVTRSEDMTFVIYDRRWVDARLLEHVSNCRNVLQWASVLMVDENKQQLELSDAHDFPTFPGTTREYVSPADDAANETLKMLGKDGEALIVVERALKNLQDRPRDSLSIGVHVRAMPDASNPVYDHTSLSLEVDRCNSLVAQQLFRPKGTTIEILKRRDSHQKSYTWRTTDGWKVDVSPESHIYLTNVPEKAL